MKPAAARKAMDDNAKALFAMAAFCAGLAGLFGLLRGLEGPVSRCEDTGGHYMVGPGGETACVDRNTFLPRLDGDGG